MTAVTFGSAPQSDLDPFSPAAIADPYPGYRALRDLGPVVHLTTHSVWFVSRYDQVRAAVADWRTFTSTQGVALTAEMGAYMKGTPLTSDPPEHDRLRSVLTDKLAPKALAKLRGDIHERADAIVARVVEQGEFDAVTDLCERLPVEIVADLIGLPREGREVLLPGAEAMLASFGPLDERMDERRPAITAYAEFMNRATTREYLSPDSWGTAILDAVDDGRIDRESAAPLMSAYLIAAMDTTVNGLAHYLKILAERPDVWAALKADPGLIAPGFEEVLRYDAVAQMAFRVATRDVEIGGVTIPGGSRVALGLASANHDERHYPDPEVYDLARRPYDHLSFGNALHACAGQGLARLEAHALVTAVLRRADRIEFAGEAVRRSTVPRMRGLESLPLSIVPAAAG